MKKRFTLFMVALACLTILLNSSCKKLLDDHGGGKGGGGSNSPSQYEITRFSYIEYTDSFFYNISYTRAGNPDSIYSTADDRWLFGYDSAGRLETLAAYGDYFLIPQISHHYYYTGDLITKDSIYWYEADAEGSPDPGAVIDAQAVYYQYDSKGRVTKAIDDNGKGQFETHDYAYDTTGNLTGIPHDDKVNWHQTNKVWQFIDRDYSVNNPLTAAYTYNSTGLPVTVTVDQQTAVMYFIAGFEPQRVSPYYRAGTFTYTHK